jgi:hypothetical protein
LKQAKRQYLKNKLQKLPNHAAKAKDKLDAKDTPKANPAAKAEKPKLKAAKATKMAKRKQKDAKGTNTVKRKQKAAKDTNTVRKKQKDAKENTAVRKKKAVKVIKKAPKKLKVKQNLQKVAATDNLLQVQNTTSIKKALKSGLFLLGIVRVCCLTHKY